MSSLDDFIRSNFDGYTEDKLRLLLLRLRNSDIASVDDLSHVDRNDLVKCNLSKIEVKKLMNLKEKIINQLELTLKMIFNMEPQEKIARYLKILNNMGVFVNQHLCMAIEEINSCPDIRPVDKKKFLHYVEQNFKKDYERNRETQKTEREKKKQEMEMEHEVSMKKLDISHEVIKGKNEEKYQILEQSKKRQNTTLAMQAKSSIVKFFKGTKASVQEMEKCENQDRKRLDKLSEKIDEDHRLALQPSTSSELKYLKDRKI